MTKKYNRNKQLDPDRKNLILSILMLIAAAAMLIWLGVQIWQTNSIDDVPASTPVVEITPEPEYEPTIQPEIEIEVQATEEAVQDVPEYTESEGIVIE